MCISHITRATSLQFTLSATPFRPSHCDTQTNEQSKKFAKFIDLFVSREQSKVTQESILNIYFNVIIEVIIFFVFVALFLLVCGWLLFS